MKKLIALAFASVLCALAQPATPKVFAALTSAGTTSAFAVPTNDLHSVVYVVTGSPSACSMRLEGSIDGTSWLDLSGAQDCTTAAPLNGFRVGSAAFNQVRIKLITLSGGTAPTATFTYLGISSSGRR